MKGPKDLAKDQFFATPIWWADSPEWVKELDKLMDPVVAHSKKLLKPALKERNKKYGLKGEFGFVANSHNLMGMEGLEEFERYVGATSFNLLDGQGYDLRNYKVMVTELWVQDFPKEGGGHRTLHTHWNSHMAGFFILKGSRLTSFPLFEDPRPGKMQTMLPEKDTKNETDATYQVYYNSKPGRFIFFPGYVPHQFIMDHGVEPFRFIHFNCQAFPKHDDVFKVSPYDSPILQGNQ